MQFYLLCMWRAIYNALDFLAGFALPVEVVMILTCCCSLLYCEGSIMFVQKS